jgi:YD repeat-containing protein
MKGMTGSRTQKLFIGFMLVVWMMVPAISAWAETINYVYDTMGRLTRAESEEGTVFVYRYDTIGNRLTETTTGSPLEVGVVAAYPFSEGSGATTADMSGHGNDGTLQGASWSMDGKVGNALSFDGTDDYVRVDHHESLNVTNMFTFAAWINTDLTQSGTLLSKDGVGGDPTGAYNIYIGKTSSEVPYINYETNNVDGLYAYNGLTANAWHHVVVTFDAAASPRMHIYVDGIERGSGDVTAPSALSNDLLIGRRGWSGDPRHFKGQIDELKIYNVALSEAEVIAFYYSYLNPGGAPGLMASYPFSEGSGSTAVDASGHGNDGTITGATWTTAGKVGNALHFDGDVDYVEIPHPGYLREGSIATWLSLDSLPDAWFGMTLTGAPIDGHDDGINLGVHPGNSENLAFGIYSNQWNWADSGITPQTDTWYHVVGTWGAEGLKIYVNGELKGTHPYTGGVPGYTQYAYIGANSWGNYLPGIADEVQIYNYALSDSEIQDLYTASDSGLVASYPFSEGSGSTTADASGNGYDGTLLNGVSWTTDGKVGNALSFDGVDDVVEVTDASDLRLRTTQTIAGWVNLSQLPAGWVRLIGKGTGTSRNYGVWLSPSGEILYQIVSSSEEWGNLFSTTQLSAGSWYHIAATYDGTAMRLYINGQEDVSVAYTSVPVVSADPLTFGYTDGYPYFPGRLDEVKLYARALSASENQNLAGVVGGGGLAALLFTGSAPMPARGDTLAEVDGQYVSINVGASPDLNYGIGDFTVVVKTRTSGTSSSRAGTPPWPPSRGEYSPQSFSRGENIPLPSSRGESMGGVSHIAVGVRQGKDLFLYLDGALQAQKSVGAGRVTRLNVNIGLDEGARKTVVEEVQLFPSALSPEEIMGLKIEDRR